MEGLNEFMLAYNSALASRQSEPHYVPPTSDYPEPPEKPKTAVLTAEQRKARDKRWRKKFGKLKRRKR